MLLVYLFVRSGALCCCVLIVMLVNRVGDVLVQLNTDCKAAGWQELGDPARIKNKHIKLECSYDVGLVLSCGL